MVDVPAPWSARLQVPADPRRETPGAEGAADVDVPSRPRAEVPPSTDLEVLLGRAEEPERVGAGGGRKPERGQESLRMDYTPGV
jgi:hypothetical protein